MQIFTLFLLASFPCRADGVLRTAGPPTIGRQDPAAPVLTAEHDGFPSDELPRSGGSFEWPATLIKSIVSCFKPPRKIEGIDKAIKVFDDSLTDGVLAHASNVGSELLELVKLSEHGTESVKKYLGEKDFRQAVIWLYELQDVADPAVQKFGKDFLPDLITKWLSDGGTPAKALTLLKEDVITVKSLLDGDHESVYGVLEVCCEKLEEGIAAKRGPYLYYDTIVQANGGLEVFEKKLQAEAVKDKAYVFDFLDVALKKLIVIVPPKKTDLALWEKFSELYEKYADFIVSPR